MRFCLSRNAVFIQFFIMDLNNIISIDLGSKFIRISYIRNGEPTSVQFQGSDTIPNAVYYGDDVWFGMEAFKKSHGGSGIMISELKRLLGCTPDDPEVKRYMEQFPNLIDTTGGTISFHIKEQEGEVSKSPIAVLSDLMLFALGITLGVAGMESIDIIAVSYPESFSERQKKALISVFTSLQIPQVEIVSDTVASCMYYFDIPDNRDCVMMVDFGSHHISLSIISISASQGYNVEITLGLDIGGEDFVDNMFHLLLEKFTLSDVSPSTRSSLRKKSIQFMKALNSSEVVSDTVEIDGEVKGVSITREEYMKYCDSHISFLHDKLQGLWEAGANRECIPRIVTVCGGYKSCSFLIDELKKVIGDVVLKRGSDYAVTYGLLHFLANNSSVQERHQALMASGFLSSSLITPILQQSSKSLVENNNHVKIVDAIVAEIPLICEDDDEFPPDLPESVLKKRSPIPDPIKEVPSNVVYPQPPDGSSSDPIPSDVVYPPKLSATISPATSDPVPNKDPSSVYPPPPPYKDSDPSVPESCVYSPAVTPPEISPISLDEFTDLSELNESPKSLNSSENLGSMIPLAESPRNKLIQQKPFTVSVKRSNNIGIKRQSFTGRDIRFLIFSTDSLPITVNAPNPLRFRANKEMYLELYEGMDPCSAKCKLIRVFHMQHDDKHPLSSDVRILYSVSVDRQGLVSVQFTWEDTGLPVIVDQDMFDEEAQAYLKEKKVKLEQLRILSKKREMELKKQVVVPPLPPMIEKELLSSPPSPPVVDSLHSLPLPPVVDSLPSPPSPIFPIPGSQTVRTLPLPPPPLSRSMLPPPLPVRTLPSSPLSMSTLPLMPIPVPSIDLNSLPPPPTNPVKKSTLVSIDDYKEDLQRIMAELKSERQKQRIRVFLLRVQVSLSEYQEFHQDMLDELEKEEEEPLLECSFLLTIILIISTEKNVI